ncbi:MarR family winged helix-turn-helix transcriptional regulator [Microbacterium telephonicum]|uniref:DNA-binding MarR family transcriptional regulator n=1 Tax=Microbacterium telephonicum TaxID=1714841 RepID=A0A498CC13_9MICO|nr:MarR family transcriptional regulator [Microbacterium telephonicum]RLK52629.1 DNA-binding MarR family transcriptional regulator [Microbacterium telephonicum]
MDEENDADAISRRVTSALARYRLAHDAMNARARQNSGMTDNELRIVQFLMTERDDSRAVTPTLIARHLGITSASTTALLDRLEKSGAIERARHPSDRRSLHITATAHAEELVDSTVGAFTDETRRIASELSPFERDAVARFFDHLAEAADAIAEEEREPRRRAG